MGRPARRRCARPWASGPTAAGAFERRAFAGADTWATALTLAKAVEKLGAADLIFCGKQAIDGDTAQVGPMLATILNIPYVAWARNWRSMTVSPSRWNASGPRYDSVQTSLPALITVSRKSTNPVPSFKPNSRPKSPPSRVGPGRPESCRRRSGVSGSFTQVVKSFPAPPCKSEVWTGAPRSWRRRLWQALKEQSKAHGRAPLRVPLKRRHLLSIPQIPCKMLA